jgi:hypothetical protein
VTLSNDALLKVLKTKFVCGFKNIKGEPYAGKSGKHDPDSPAVVTTDGAGPHNVQIFLLSSDGTVLHCLPGFWAPADLLLEIQFAQGLNKIWKNPNYSQEKKNRLFREANMKHVLTHPLDMRQRSHLQSFDAKEERNKENSDFQFKPGDYRPPVLVAAKKMAKMSDLKSVDQVVHERMAHIPFVPYDEFDVEKFSDYGKMGYDKHENQPPKVKNKKK